MRKSVVIFISFLSVFYFARSLVLARGTTETITGKVIDLFCYDPKTGANSGMDHKAIGAAGQEGRECAMACAKWEGQPVGLLTDDGKVYQLTGGIVAGNNAKIAPHITHTVRITGEVEEKHGILTLTADDLTMVSN